MTSNRRFRELQKTGRVCPIHPDAKVTRTRHKSDKGDYYTAYCPECEGICDHYDA